MRAKTPLKLLVAAIGLLCLSNWAGYDGRFYRTKLLSACKVRVERVELQPEATLLPGTTGAVFSLAIWNPYPISLTINSATFSLFTGDKEVGRASTAAGGQVTIAASGSSKVPLIVDVDLGQALPGVMASARESLKEMKLRDLGLLIQQAGNGNLRDALKMLRLDLRVEGDVLVDTVLGDATLHVKRGGKPARANQDAAPATNAPSEEPSKADTEPEQSGEHRRW